MYNLLVSSLQKDKALVQVPGTLLMLHACNHVATDKLPARVQKGY